MVATFLARLFGRSPASSAHPTVVVGSDGDSSGTDAGGEWTPEPARSAGNGAPSEHEEPALQAPPGLGRDVVSFARTRAVARWRGEIERRVERILENSTKDDRCGDGPSVLKSLAEDAPSAIRQLPLAAQKALAACEDPAGDTSRLVRLIERDPTLTQGLLKYANSAAFATGGPCTTLLMAVNRVGVAGVQTVLLAATMEGLLCRPGGDYDVMLRKVWEHMVRVGPLAREIAPVFHANAEQAFLLGLLHDVGKLVLFDRLSERRMAQRRQMSIPPEFLAIMLRELHEPLGALVVVRWGLHEDAAEPVGNHHRMPPPEACPLSETIHVAERLDLSLQKRETLDLRQLWASAELTGDIGELTRMMSDLVKKHAPKLVTRSA